MPKYTEEQIQAAHEMLDRVEKHDSWTNDVTGFGTPNMSRLANISFSGYTYISRVEAEKLYRFDWAARKAIDAPIFDMMRTDIDFLEDEENDVHESVEVVEDELDRLEFEKYLELGLTESDKQGGALLVFFFDDGLDYSVPLNPNMVRGINRIEVVTGGREGFAQPIKDYDDMDSPKFGEPEIYNITINKRTYAATLQVHESRCIRLDSVNKTSPLIKIKNAGWNDSRLSGIYEALMKMGVAINSGAETLENFTFKVLKMADLAEKMMTDSGFSIMKRITGMINRITSGRVAAIGEGETLESHGTPVTGLSDLISIYSKQVPAAANMPYSRFFSGEGGALNGNVMDGDTLNYYDWIKVRQLTQRKPALKKVIEFISYYLKFDPTKIDFSFGSLWEQSAEEKARTYLTTMQADNIACEKGVITPEEWAKSRYSGAEMDFTSMHVDFEERDFQAEAEMISPEEAAQMVADGQKEVMNGQELDKDKNEQDKAK